MFLTIVTLGSLAYRLASLMSLRLRLYALIGPSTLTNSTQAKKVLTKLGLSEWFLLRFLKLNLDHATFKSLIRLLYEEL